MEIKDKPYKPKRGDVRLTIKKLTPTPQKKLLYLYINENEEIHTVACGYVRALMVYADEEFKLVDGKGVMQLYKVIYKYKDGWVLDDESMKGGIQKQFRGKHASYYDSLPKNKEKQ